jgi:hypothetical protein
MQDGDIILVKEIPLKRAGEVVTPGPLFGALAVPLWSLTYQAILFIGEDNTTFLEWPAIYGMKAKLLPEGTRATLIL